MSTNVSPGVVVVIVLMLMFFCVLSLFPPAADFGEKNDQDNEDEEE